MCKKRKARGHEICFLRKRKMGQTVKGRGETSKENRRGKERRRLAWGHDGGA